MKNSAIAHRILTTAGRLFYKNGYSATGINKIISEANVAKATLYHHFESKDDICITYLGHRHREFITSLQNFISVKNTPVGQVLGIFDYLQELYREEDFYGCWAIKIYGELPHDNEKITKAIRNQKKDLLLYLGELARKNFLNASNAEVEKMSCSIYLFYETAITESHIHQNDWPIHLAKNTALALLRDMKMVEAKKSN